MTFYRPIILLLAALSLVSFGCASGDKKPDGKKKKPTEKRTTTANRIDGRKQSSPPTKPAKKEKKAKEKPAKPAKREKVLDDVVTRGGFR